MEPLWRDWLGKKSRLSGREAALRVMERMEERRFSIPYWVPAGAVAGLLIIVSLSYLQIREKDFRPEADFRAGEMQAVQLHTEEMLIWLDEKTPLLMNYPVTEPGGNKGGIQ